MSERLCGVGRGGAKDCTVTGYRLACSSRRNVWVNCGFLSVLRSVLYGTTSTRGKIDQKNNIYIKEFIPTRARLYYNLYLLQY